MASHAISDRRFTAFETEALFTESLADPDADVRAIAVGGLGDWPGVGGLDDWPELSWEKCRAKLLERLAVETDTRVCRKIWQRLECVARRGMNSLDPHVAKALRKYFLARLPVADACEVRRIKFSRSLQGDGKVLKALAEWEQALKAQATSDPAPASGTSPTP